MLKKEPITLDGDSTMLLFNSGLSLNISNAMLIYNWFHSLYNGITIRNKDDLSRLIFGVKLMDQYLKDQKMLDGEAVELQKMEKNCRNLLCTSVYDCFLKTNGVQFNVVEETITDDEDGTLLPETLPPPLIPLPSSSSSSNGRKQKYVVLSFCFYHGQLNSHWVVLTFQQMEQIIHLIPEFAMTT